MFRTGIVMLVLSTQALSRETDVVETMRISIQSFMPTLAAAMALAVVGCGGGSSNTVVEPTGNPHLVSADSRIMSPKLMTVDGTDIYFANQGNTGINSVLRISQVESLDTAGYPDFYEVYGAEDWSKIKATS
jgi:hypothetical protein